ncbi:MAG: glucosaminidase domain-containing protein [Chloroflexota bacterium]
MPRPSHYRPGGSFTLDTNLLSDSGASAWAINQYLAANTSLPPLGAAFLAAEAKYGVNAKFLLAAAMHESGMGSSAIARIKHNLFGYNAYDRDPLGTRAPRHVRREHQRHGEVHEGLLPDAERPLVGGAPTLRSMQQFWSSSGR